MDLTIKGIKLIHYNTLLAIFLYYCYRICIAISYDQFLLVRLPKDQATPYALLYLDTIFITKARYKKFLLVRLPKDQATPIALF